MQPTLLERYRVVRPLGQGGRGQVFLCDDLRLPGRQWAVKRMLLDEVDDDGRERFRRSFEAEATTLSRLSHPLLPHVADFFEEDGAWYLVMELIPGDNLQSYVQRAGPFPPDVALRHGVTLARILQHLHGQDPPLLFRDLKPANCMRVDESTLKLVDFGLASASGSAQAGQEMALGSVGYSPPEQWSRDEPQDQRLDIYAWGATMVYLLTGHHPSPHTPQQTLRTGCPQLPEGFAAIVLRCLEFEPEQRWPHVGALLDALTAEALRLGVETADLARPAGRTSEVRKRSSAASSATLLTTSPSTALPPRRSQLGWRLGLACLVLGVLAALASWTLQTGRARQAPGASERRRLGGDDLALGRRCYAEGRWAEAIAALDQACTAAPEDAAAAILKENAYARLSRGPVEVLPFVGPETGSDAPEYDPHLDGMALAQAEINARGGLRGRKLVIELVDDHSATTEVLKAVQRLAEDTSVRCVLGPTSSQRLLAASPLATSTHLNLVSPTASSERIWSGGPYIFTASDGRGNRVAALARYLLKRGCHRCCVVTDPTNRLGVDMAERFHVEVERNGGTCRELPPYHDSAASIDETLAALKQEHPDAVFFADYRVQPLARFATALRQRGETALLCSQTVPFARELIEQGGSAIEGLILTDFFHPQVATPKMQAFVKAYSKRFARLTPTYQAANSYDAVNVVVEGLSCTRTREELRDWLAASGRTRPPFDGVSGQFALGRRLDARPIWIIEVHDGRFVLHPR